MMCEQCWSDAYQMMYLLGGSQTDHYYQLLKERKDNPCIGEGQEGGVRVRRASKTACGSGSDGEFDSPPPPPLVPG